MTRTPQIGICSGKGGVGKTSLAVNVSATLASVGYRVCLVDLDPGACVGDELGYSENEEINDRGEGLTNSLMVNVPLRIVHNVRENLDVVVGGDRLHDVAHMREPWERRGINPTLVLSKIMGPVAENYDLVIFDTPPGEVALQQLVLGAATHVIIPTRADKSSVEGITRLADQFAKARHHNPDLELLGVVVFGVRKSETRVMGRVRTKVTTALGGVAPVFDTSIQYLSAPATDARENGLAVFEYARDVVDTADPWFKRAVTDSAPAPSRTAGKLAADYADLAFEILTRLGMINPTTDDIDPTETESGGAQLGAAQPADIPTTVTLPVEHHAGTV